MHASIKERPILFNAQMVRAILDGRKTQTRRIVTNQPCDVKRVFMRNRMAYVENEHGVEVHLEACKFGQPGERLWVRETWRKLNEKLLYRADYSATHAANNGGVKWKPSIHMPRLASRILLEITGVRVERLQDIREEDAKAEGVATQDYPTKTYKNWADGMHRLLYKELWARINGPGSWDANPWVWVIEFKVVKS
ncbi:hypothetical protein GALL_71800 [mine drainage metagenome]|uniref:ASCH domain-containing protein n=1 Tax=mine drainage metagenome TaxID=410659 RepID=A0A1J5SR81_9ZZZZ